MKEQAIQKINKIGKISNIIAVIAKIFLIAGLVVSILGAAVCFILPKDTVTATIGGTLRTEVNVGAVAGMGSIEEQELLETLELEEGYNIKVEEFNVGFVDGGFVSMNSQDYMPVETKVEGNKIITDMEAVADTINIRDMGILCIVACVAMVMTLITMCFVQGLCKAFRDCQSPFEENVIKKMQNLAISLIPWTIVSSVTGSVMESWMSNGVHITFSIDFGVVLVVLIVLVLVYIFKYGAVLQQESDETL